MNSTKRGFVPKKDEIQQDQLDELTVRTVKRDGGINYLQARFYQEVGHEVMACDSNSLDPIMPRIEVQNNVAWNRAMNLCIAYLKRYQMKKTLDMMKTEYDSIPRSTGYQRASEIDTAFQDIFENTKHLQQQTFEDKVNNLKYTVDSVIPEKAYTTKKTTSPRKKKEAGTKRKKASKSPQK